MRLSLLCGALFAAGAMATAAVTIVDAPRRAMTELRARLTACPLPGLRCAPPDVFLHQRAIGAPTDPSLGPPDPDTLVSSAWIDLTAGPVRLDIPAPNDRFFAIQVLDGRDDHAAVASARTIGRDGGSLVLTRGAQPAGTGSVTVATDWVWIVARFAVDGEADVPAVNALQTALRVSRR